MDVSKVRKARAPRKKSNKTSTSTSSRTKTSTEVRSPTSTSTEVRSPTSTSTDAYTQGNVTVTGGAGAGPTIVYLGQLPSRERVRADIAAEKIRSRGSSTRAVRMIKATGAPRVKAVMPKLMSATMGGRMKKRKQKRK